MIDSTGFRHNVGIILSNTEGQVFWARRIGRDVWQFPQGGICKDETPEQAMFRELKEETGLHKDHVSVIGCTRKWLKYRLPQCMIRRGQQPLCIGQKQIWFMLRLHSSDQNVKLNLTNEPEFDNWKWVNYWYPIREVVSFKRSVYKRALTEFAPLL